MSRGKEWTRWKIRPAREWKATSWRPCLRVGHRHDNKNTFKGHIESFCWGWQTTDVLQRWLWPWWGDYMGSWAGGSLHAAGWAARVRSIHGELRVWPTAVEPYMWPHSCRHSSPLLHCLNTLLKAQRWLCNFPISVPLPYFQSNTFSLCWHSRADNVTSTYFLAHISPFYLSKFFSSRSGLLISLVLFVPLDPLGITFVSCCVASLYTCVLAWINLLHLCPYFLNSAHPFPSRLNTFLKNFQATTVQYRSLNFFHAHFTSSGN